MMVGGAPLRILAVCSHNRTRSVMIEAMLTSMLRQRLGEDSVDVVSSGFGPVGLPPIDEAVEAMGRRGLDVSSHRSSATTRELVESVDLVLTAERQHVVKIASLSPASFRQAMTLPEFLDAAASSASDEDDGVRSWVRSLTEPRTASAYLREPVPEVADPTGSVSRIFEAAVVAIEQQCRIVCDLVIAGKEFLELVDDKKDPRQRFVRRAISVALQILNAGFSKQVAAILEFQI